MADEPHNRTLRVLRDMRAEMRGGFEKVTADISALNTRFDDFVQRIDGNTLTFNLVAGVVYNHEGRIAALEQDEA